MEKGQERRKFKRLNVSADVVYKKRDTSKKEKLSLSRNISKGGICLIAYDDLKESDILDLEIFLPQEKTPINITGRVVWTKQFSIGVPTKGERLDVGVEFIKAETQDLEKINQYVFTRL